MWNHKGSLTWFENENGVKFSGAPGYLKGRPLLVGKSVSNPGNLDEEFVEYDPNGFALRGADNDGKCYFVDEI